MKSMSETAFRANADRLENGLLPIFECDVTVQYNEADQHGFVRTVALLNYLQSAAGYHAALLGVSVADLVERGHTWVLSRIHLAMQRYPRGGDTIRIRTWPALRETLLMVRDFELCDSAGIPLGRATTAWAVVNLKTRRLAKLADVLPNYPLHPRRALDDPFGTLPVLEKPESELRLPVLRGDLDVNRHVNNTVYAGWALETIPEEVDKNCCLAGLEIGFRAEALYGDTIVARSAKTEQADWYLHSIENGSDGRELARLRTHWLPRTDSI